ncbi:hypothetical protein [Bryobacter aggregatus]|uniref:hypothetical protein n=1 Tax=Bryobacter aggregatus TaxID=360054 RepID=UPI0004E0D103|nr:hypothetical protein [Bryobacter aggregatus]
MKKSGTIQAMNLSPKGRYRGFLLKTSKGTVQINLPKGKTNDLLKPGVEIAAEVEEEESRGKRGHRVFRLLHLLKENGGNGHSQFSGKVLSLNYARHGEVNGGILDSGDFLHLKPEAARAVALKVGMEVTGVGHTKPMAGDHAGDHLVIEAEEVNGIQMDLPRKATKQA